MEPYDGVSRRGVAACDTNEEGARSRCVSKFRIWLRASSSNVARPARSRQKRRLRVGQVACLGGLAGREDRCSADIYLRELQAELKRERGEEACLERSVRMSSARAVRKKKT